MRASSKWRRSSAIGRDAQSAEQRGGARCGSASSSPISATRFSGDPQAGVPQMAAMATPHLTTVALPLELAGRVAIELLAEQIDGTRAGGVQEQTLDV